MFAGMESCSANTQSSNSCAAVPPIVIHGGTPCSLTSGNSLASNTGPCVLPPITPQATASNGQVLYQNHWSTKRAGVSGDHNQYGTTKLEHSSHGQASSCMLSNNCQIPATSRNPPNKLQSHFSPLAFNSSSTGIHLQPPQNGQVMSDLSPSYHSLKSGQSRIFHFDPNSFSKTGYKTGRLKTEARQGLPRLPPLQSGYASGSNLDVEDTMSPLVPPINSLSPYIGSGISDIPSLPSILSPMSSAQLSRKRALSTSPLSDMLDIYGIRSSPNSLMATLYNSSNPMTPNGGGTVGHMMSQSNASQYRVQQRKTSIEHNQNNDGTTKTTITNQITFSENIHDMVLETQAELPNGSEPMETDHTNAHDIKDEDFVEDPHICLWEQCGQNFKDLDELVRHIENNHIEKGKADEYICLWQSCIRRQKPFNARYKLLIHMRIHSGEKPNKCTVSPPPPISIAHPVTNTTLH